jgi:hypothetical protein
MNYELSYSQKYYQENKERIKQRNKEWVKNNKEKHNAATKARYERVKNTPEFQEYSKERKLSYRQACPERVLYLSAKNRAKKLGLPFDIELEDIVIPELCPYFQTPISRLVGKGKVDTNPSVDRIDSSKGYIKGNVQVISLLANRMKQNASIEQMVMFAEGVLKLHNKSSMNCQ